jgi:hypothetical protein
MSALVLTLTKKILEESISEPYLKQWFYGYIYITNVNLALNILQGQKITNRTSIQEIQVEATRLYYYRK